MKVFSGLIMILSHFLIYKTTQQHILTDVLQRKHVIRPTMSRVLELNKLRNLRLRFHFGLINIQQYWFMKLRRGFIENLIAYNDLSDSDRSLINFFIIEQMY